MGKTAFPWGTVPGLEEGLRMSVNGNDLLKGLTNSLIKRLRKTPLPHQLDPTSNKFCSAPKPSYPLRPQKTSEAQAETAKRWVITRPVERPTLWALETGAKPWTISLSSHQASSLKVGCSNIFTPLIGPCILQDLLHPQTLLSSKTSKELWSTGCGTQSGPK